MLLLAGACTSDSQARAVQEQLRLSNALDRVQQTDTSFAALLSSAFRGAAESVLPSVVFVSVEREIAGEMPAQIPDLFRRFFDFDAPAPETPVPPQIGSGSGFVFDDEGHIITNHHVVAEATRVDVRTFDGQEFEAEVVGSDPVTDIALLRVGAHGGELSRAPIGDSQSLLIGDWVIALGNPLGLDFTVTAGIVSARGRRLTGRQSAVESFIQTDAAINPGNSGGPLVDLSGRVVGINTAIAGSDRFVGYGFAVPMRLALEVVDDLLEYGYARRPRLGIRVSSVTAVDAEVYGLDRVRGAEVNTVDPDSPAEGRLEVGDVILELDGDPIETANDLTAGLRLRDPGEEVELVVQRDRRQQRIRVVLGEFEQEEAETRPVPGPDDAEELMGFRLQSLTPQLANQFGIERDSGLIITDVRPFSQAARAGVRAGQILLELNGEPVRSTSAFRDQAEGLEADDVVSLRVIDPEVGETIVNFRARRP
jgi:serine protease Do